VRQKVTYVFVLQLILAVFFALYAALVFGQTANKAVEKLPNIIYIYADDLGYGELGCYGQQKIKTPNLDRMAKEGMRFTRHYAGAPVCAPSRAMLMTGKHSGHSYIRGNYELGGFKDDEEGGQMPFPEGVFTLPKMLKQAGYVTGMAGKWGLGLHGTTGDPLQHGFDYYYGLLDQKQAHNFYPTHLWENGKRDTLNNPFIYVHRRLDSANATDNDFEYFKGKDYAIDKMTEKALRFIDKNKGLPFFLYLSYTLPHVSLQVPDEKLEQYKGQFKEHPYYGQRGYASHQYPLTAYAAMISYLDEQAGIVMDKIKKLGLDESTIIMFSSDNGASPEGGTNPEFFNSTAGLRGLKRDLYEGGIRVPFIARWPGKIPAGKISGHISAQYDLLATLAELTKQVIPNNTDGISFLPELLNEGRSQNDHRYLYFEFPENGGQVAIRMGPWKGVRRNVRLDKNAPWELYNLFKDENETTNVAKSHPDVIEKFKAIQLQEHQHPHIKEWEFIDPKFETKK
jgi:arylsulfatase A-like enzyme